MDKNRKTLKFIIVITLLLAVIYLSLVVGDYDISFDVLIKSLFTNNDSLEATVINSVRVPRIITALAVGATLSISGYLIKIVFDNPLADSGILGIQSGASTFALIVMLIFPNLFGIMPLIAFLGGMCAFGILLLLSFKGHRLNPLMMILAGVAISAFFNAINGIIQSLNKDSVQYTLGWLQGTIANVSMSDALTIMIYSIIALIISIVLIPILKVIRLDDQMITNLGKNPYLLRMVVTTVGVLLACISVSFVGIIGFVGIIIPHFAQVLVGYKDQYAMPMSMLLGSLLVSASDLLQKVLFYPNEVAVGIIIGLIGTPLFIFFVRRERML